MSDQSAKFVQGSTMRHILVMSGTASIGLMALFVVDLLDMFFISMLGQVELAAAIGFAGTIIFFSTSVSIGSSIAMGALVSKSLGAKENDRAKQLASSTLVIAFIVNSIVTIIMFCFIPELLAMIGAKGVVAERAQAYLSILLPSTPIIAIAMAAGAGLRAVGDAKRSMLATLYGGLVNAVLDPIFIFGFNMNVEGAAIASVISRLTVLIFSLYPLIVTHKLVTLPQWKDIKHHTPAIFTIAIPAIITNTATPIGNAIVTSTLAPFGEDFVAGFAVIGRLIPVTFAVIFAMSGAVGPIIGQNYGAKRVDRVKETLRNSLLFSSVYCVFVSLILYLLQDQIIAWFSLVDDAALIMTTFCTVVAITFIFNGAMFVANTSFNNLGKPLYSTALNLSKATIGTLPFVYFGAQWYGGIGVLYGQALGNIVFGIISILVLKIHVSYMVKEHCKAVSSEDTLGDITVTMTPFCNNDAVIMQSGVENKEKLDHPSLSG
ncbi:MULTISPECIES: MATE family efflux transporter [Aliivibrio]|uniref:Multidrug resistance protein NorM n=1 Tax=Aliivibrio finisterrensis TaxID=511998 RepID=A0A4Q5KTU2_9GAMM|nr:MULTISPECIES: MATE family efflux transporter [Aliivibrio]MDD9177679.1 MATE family efflux transporter [Aliivibrio sp. A6]RYU51290.1 MATE family efflux transporter [Aliivibrio finisterrensis]RYU54487.1 MATE family efflux transporter [Aliivibrio finisterrensis]RYU59555.1 MATE family efflux transporter [Aliivibrio finisterrensis]RYU65430.1 MATE family efflux transporter [Aliivibrio finisterrensis]